MPGRRCVTEKARGVKGMRRDGEGNRLKEYVTNR